MRHDEGARQPTRHAQSPLSSAFPIIILLSLSGTGPKLARRKKPYCLCHAQPKVRTSSEELNAQISPRTDEEHNLPYHEDY